MISTRTSPLPEPASSTATPGVRSSSPRDAGTELTVCSATPSEFDAVTVTDRASSRPTLTTRIRSSPTRFTSQATKDFSEARSYARAASWRACSTEDLSSA
ncbi:hypothetical protein LI98_13940 [Mycolicibacterium smegmatis]|nr:hypothetical protein LI98_13940 [Mycolicibacterium smegmatis]